MAEAQPRPSALELYLQERWPAVSANEPDIEKCRKKIMAEYLAMGVKGRWKYHQMVEEREPQFYGLPDPPQPPPPPVLQGDLTVADIRCDAERRCAAVLSKDDLFAWVQTSYAGPDNCYRRGLDDHDIAEATGSTDSDKPELLPLVADKAVFEGLNLDEIVNRLPELAESFEAQRDPEEYQTLIQEALESIVARLDTLNKRAETKDIPDLEEHQDRIMMRAHEDYVTGCFWVQDEHADYKDEMLLVWVDQYGRAIRTKRVKDTGMYSGMLDMGWFNENPNWMYAEQTDLYNPLPDEEIDRINAM